MGSEPTDHPAPDTKPPGALGRAPIVVAATHPQITFLRQLDASDLPGDFVDDIRNWRSRSGTVKINLALDRAPVFAAKPDQADLTGGFELAHSVACLEQACGEARAGRPATAPFSDGCMPTFVDPSLAPEGKHVVSLFTQWCPAEWADEPDDAALEAYADRVIAGYDGNGLKRGIGPAGRKLSGGERALLALARALLAKRPFLILDEPFTGLDPDTIETLWVGLEARRRRGTRRQDRRIAARRRRGRCTHRSCR